jgi:prolyl oligopeptidase
MMEKKLFSAALKATFITTLLAGCMTRPIQHDPYIWMEEVQSDKALAWVRTQNQRTTSDLEKNPLYAQIHNEALQILTAKDKIPMINFAKNHVYNFWTDEKNPRGLYRRTTYEEYKKQAPRWEVVLDIDELGRVEKKSWVFQGCSTLRPESDVCLMMLSDGGKDAREVREFNLKTKKFVQNGFFLPLAKSSLAWFDRDTLLVATHFGEGSLTESGYPREVRILKRGQKLEDAQKIFEIPAQEMRAYVYNECVGDVCNTFVVQNKDFFRHNYYWFKKNEGLVQINIPDTAELHGFFKDNFYFSLTKQWKDFKPGSLLKAKFEDLQRPTVLYVPDARSSFEQVFFSKNHVYLSVLENVTRKVYKLEGERVLVPFPAPAVGNTYVAAIDSYQDRALFTFENSITQPTLYEWGPSFAQVKSMPPRFRSEGLVVEQNEAKSFDGTMIPYFIIRHRDTEGPQPTLMTAYGGFQIPLSPYYEGVQGRVWLNRGGQFVIANIRGGGEFGPSWHEAALKSRRQVAYNDLFAVTESLIQKGYTTPDQLALIGGSNGGLLAGVTLTQRPELYKAIIIQVPLLDMLRYHKLPAGASWISEYGNPEIPEERKYLEKYSPYQHLEKGRKYPSVFLMTSTFDDRVHPGHARKFGARLEEFQIPFLYFENMEGGHSGAADPKQRARNIALYFTFLFEQLFPQNKLN